jgi:hypothetical protein
MNYHDKIVNHLTGYKSKNFTDIPNGTYRGKLYGYILPKNHKTKNFIETYRDDILKSNLYSLDKLHIYFHHLNSSQAMCINFFFPLYKEHKLEVITDFLGLKNEKVNYETVCFEKIGKDGGGGRRPTNFDFYFETLSKKKIFFEIKYTENEFGKAKNDADHIDKYDNVYSKYLLPISIKYRSREQFFNNYQILRNVIHIDKNSFVVFIYPLENKKINAGAEKAKSELLTASFKDNFFAVTWEKLFEAVFNSTSETKLKSHLRKFKDKYLPIW